VTESLEQLSVFVPREFKGGLVSPPEVATLACCQQIVRAIGTTGNARDEVIQRERDPATSAPHASPAIPRVDPNPRRWPAKL